MKSVFGFSEALKTHPGSNRVPLGSEACRVGAIMKIIMKVMLRVVLTNMFADGHTASNAPDLFRPPKLSGAGPG